MADEAVIAELLKRDDIIVEEKIDGANVGVCYYKGHFYVRNRRHILKKGFVKKNNPAQAQFRPLWNWLEQHKGQFQLLNEMSPFSEEEPATVFGEWCWMAHGIHYTDLPSFFIAFDLYDPCSHSMMWDRRDVRTMLTDAHFEVPPVLATGYVHTDHYLIHLSQSRSQFYKGRVEGIYVRHRDWDAKAEKRYKMVREDFERGKYFREDEIIRNLLKKS